MIGKQSFLYFQNTHRPESYGRVAGNDGMRKFPHALLALTIITKPKFKL